MVQVDWDGVKVMEISTKVVLTLNLWLLLFEDFRDVFLVLSWLLLSWQARKVMIGQGSKFGAYSSH